MIIRINIYIQNKTIARFSFTSRFPFENLDVNPVLIRLRAWHSGPRPPCLIMKAPGIATILRERHGIRNVLMSPDFHLSVRQQKK